MKSLLAAIFLRFAVVSEGIADGLDFAIGEVEVEDAIVAVAVFAEVIRAVLT